LPGIYLHIPFCKQACHYCNFHFTTSLKYKDDLVNALIKEILLRKDLSKHEVVHTIYFGGGTPSLLTIADCKLLFDSLRQNFRLAADAEITLEANPDDIIIEKLKGWKDAGINRLSIGVQSFFEEELLWMNRAHNKKQAVASLQLAMAHFENITIDLIYGSPLLTDEMWEHNVKTAIGYGIPHLSCYALTVEEKTPLHKQINLQQKQPVDGDKQAHQFLLLMQWLRSAGYEHYEVSNFAKPGFRSRHNSAYWKGVHYIGIGPSAHSYNVVARQWNVANNQKYIASINAGILPEEEEILTEQNQLNEYIMISLRTMEGLNLDVVEQKWGIEKKELMIKQLHPFILRKQVVQKKNLIQLTDEGMLAGDGIAAELFSPLLPSPLSPGGGT
jgi:oxygen-independent coproporphyrinogen-3 oxidase